MLSSLALIPGHAFAHGQEMLLFPIGTLIAVAAVFALAASSKARWPVKLCAVLLALAATLPFWFLSQEDLPAVMAYTGWGNFVFGFVPSIAVGGLVVWLAYRNRPRS